MSDVYLVKRPSSKDDDDDLEQMQREFTQGKVKPSAEIVRRTSTLKTNTSSSDAPQPIPSSETIPESTTVPVLFEVVERDVVNFPISEPNLHIKSLPPSKFALKKGMKKSIFLQEMENMGKSVCESNTCPPKITEKDMASVNCKVEASSAESSCGNSEAQIIHEENLNRISKMTEHEIMEEKTRLEKQLGPDLVEFIRSRKKGRKLKEKDESPSKSQNPSQNVSKSNNSLTYVSEEKLSGDINETILKKSEGCDHDALLLEKLQDLKVESLNPEDVKTETKNSENAIKVDEVPENELPVDLMECGKKYLHMDKVEKNKLAWMTLLPKPKPINLKSGYTARFDFEGKLLSRDETIPTQKGLHHHSSEPEVPGYSIEELFMLSRSSFQSHRIAALQTLAYILENYWDGRFDGCFEAPLLATLLNSGIAPLLRYALDDSAMPSIAAAVLAVHHLLVCRADEVCLDWTFCWQNGQIAPFLGAEDSEPNVNLAELTDTNIIKLDVIKGLLRMDILPRFRYILKVMNPAPSVCQLILEICTRMSRHSEKSAKQIAEFPGLLDEVFTKFLPLVWSCQGKSSEYYPLHSAMKFIRILASASCELACLLVKNYHLTDSLKRYLAIDPSDGKLPEADIQKLMIESLRTWKVLMSYGLCTEIYYEMFPLLIKYFQFCLTLSLNGNVENNIQNHEFALYLLKVLESIVEHVAKMPRVARSAGLCQPSLQSWKEIFVLFQMCERCLKHWLYEFSIGGTSYAGRLLLSSCLDLFIVFCDTADANALFKADILTSSQEIMEHLTVVMRNVEFTNFLSYLSSCSVLLHSGKCGKLRDVKVLTSLGSISWKENVIPFLEKEAPIPLLSSITRLIVAVHSLEQTPVIQTVSQLFGNQQLIIEYLEKFVSISHIFHQWFDRFEVELIYHMLRVFCIMDNNKKKELSYKVALLLITCFNTPFEAYAECILRNIVFNPKFFGSEDKEILSQESLYYIQNFYCSYFLGSEHSANSRFYIFPKTLSFDSSGLNLLSKTWCYDPILEYYERSKQSGSKPLSPAEQHNIKCCLQWTNSSAKLKNSAITAVPLSVQFCGLCMIFLMDIDLFANSEIQDLLSSCLHNIILHQERLLLTKVKWGSVTNFEEIFCELLVQFESVSYGNALFGTFIMFPLQQMYPSKWKLLLLAEHPHSVRFLHVPLSKLIVPIQNYLEPLETDKNVLECYFKLLCSGTISQHHTPSLFLIAIHHLHHFLQSEDSDPVNSELKTILQNSIKQMKNKEVLNAILQYPFQDVP